MKKGQAFFANCARASRKDFREAVRAARKAVPGWSGRSAFNRSQILYRVAEMLEDRAALFTERLTELTSLSRTEAAKDVSCAVDRIFWYAGWADKFTPVFGSMNPVASPFLTFTSAEPTGVVAVLPPRTSPLLGFVSAILPALTPGNTCVVVVDSDAPTIACDLTEVFAVSDLPAGVINVLTGDRGELLPHVASHMDINAVSLFGGTVEEKTLLETEAAENLKRVRCFDDATTKGWREETAQSPYWIEPFVEWKTTWHPVGL